jgi:hypothetical protein
VRILRSFRWALLIGVVLLLSASPALCQVSFSQGNSNVEPLSADNTINYNVPITNDRTSTMSYSVALTVGPDKDNNSINFISTQDYIFVDPGKTKIVTISVNFHNPSLNKGEFNRWLGDKNDASVWEKAWYRAEIKTIIGIPTVLEDYSGHPNLVKVIVEYRNPKVTPAQGTQMDKYAYNLTVLSSYKDNITLEVAPSLQGPWTNKGVRSYTNPGLLQTLTWANITLGFDFNAAYYRFKGRIEPQPIVGPVWPIVLQFKNNTLSPSSGTPETEFRYTLEVNASKPVDVLLNVMDLSTGKYIPAGFKNYKNSTKWEKLTWPDIKVTSKEDVVGQSSYYFSFHYPGAPDSFNSTKDISGVVYPGPNISSVEINANVIPANGSIYTPFTYVAKMNTSKAAADIELEIQPPNGTIWQGQGKQTYSRNNHMLKWPNLSFRGSPDVLGIGKYRFTLDNAVLGEFLGPEIDVAVRNESFKKRADNNFDYSAEVRSNRPKVDMELMFTDDGVTWKRSGLFRTYISGNNSSSKTPWIVLTWENQPWHKTIRVDERRIK